MIDPFGVVILHNTAHSQYLSSPNHRLAGWNDLSGTLPEELSFLSDSLKELNIGGGSLSGSIPETFNTMTNLNAFNVNDHCLTGFLPDFSALNNIQVLSVYNNGELYGSLNNFCNGTEMKTPELLISSDCGGCTGRDNAYVECDCCSCCNQDIFECCNNQGESWASHNLGDYTESSPSFNKQCLQETSMQWIRDECPCIIDSNFGKENTPANFVCTKDCTAEGATPSF